MCGFLRIGCDAHLGDMVAVPHGGHRPVRAQQRIAHRRLRRFYEREHLLPRPVRLLERALPREEVGQQLAEARLSAREVLDRVVADLLEDHIVLRRTGDEGRVVLQHEIERARVRLVLDQLGSIHIEDLDREPQNGAELGVGAQVVIGAREANQRVVATRLGVDALGIGGRHVAEDLDCCPHYAERLRVSAAYSASGPLSCRRLTDRLLPEVDDLGCEFLDVWIDGLDLRRIADEIG